MRTVRIVEAGAAYYHVLSRVVDRRFVFDDGEKERFRKTMRQVERFTGCEAIVGLFMVHPPMRNFAGSLLNDVDSRPVYGHGVRPCKPMHKTIKQRS